MFVSEIIYLYILSMLGREFIVDDEDIEEYSVLETIDGIKPLMKNSLKIVI
jgi:hypothetical protein